MNQLIRKILKDCLSKRDWELQRISRHGKSPFMDFQRLCGDSLTNPILFDVGANTGQTYLELRALFPNGKIHAFEPFPEAFSQLQACSATDSSAIIHPIALSNHAGSTTLYVNAASATNSLLRNSKIAGRFQPEGSLAPTQQEIQVSINTLDQFAAENAVKKIHLLKTDTQGGDLKVLEGGVGLFESCSIGAVVCEVLFVPMYEEQCHFEDVFSWLTARNMHFSSLYNVAIDPRTGVAMWADALFLSSKF